MTLCLCELGWLFSKVDGYVQSVLRDNLHLHNGLIVQAFAFALQDELHDYYRLLAVLEQECVRKSETSLDASKGLTLIRLRTWLHEPIERFWRQIKI